MGHLRLVHSLRSAPAPAPTGREALPDELAFLHETARRLDAAPPEVESLAQGGAADSGAFALNVMPALLETARIVPRQPASVRARAIVRARAALAKGAPAEPPPVYRGRGRRLGVAVTVCLAFAVGAAGATAALYDRGWRSPPVDALLRAAHAPPSTEIAKVAGTDPAPVDPLVSAGPVRVIKPKRPPRATVPERPSSYAAELECLERAQVAFAARDFRAALAAALEHARRFPNGWLAEQREALGVRSLAGVGRTAEAHSAAITFSARFPRSVLLSHLQEPTD